MTISIPTAESLKDRAPVIRKFFKEKYNIDVSQGHSLELISKLFGFKDWNTASASLRPKEPQHPFPAKIRTVGDMKKLLAQFNDMDSINADYSFKVKDLLESADDFESPEDEIIQYFSLSYKSPNEGVVTFELKLEHESLSQEISGELAPECGHMNKSDFGSTLPI